MACEPILRRAGIIELPGQRPEAMVCRAQIVTALDSTARALGDPALGLHYAKLVNLAGIGPPAQAARLSLTLADAIAAGSRLMRLSNARTPLRLHVQGQRARLSFQVVGSDSNGVYLFSDFVLTVIHRLMRSFTGTDWRPSLIEFSQRPRCAPRIYEEFFGAPVTFGQGASGIVFDSVLLRARQPNAWPGAAAAIIQGAASQPEPDDRESTDDELIQHIEHVIDGMLTLDQISFVSASRTLGFAPRTLQNRLARLGLSFQRMTDKRRETLAKQLLADPGFCVGDVAATLGYTDAANFTRAFYRWSGTSPAAYRHGNVNLAPEDEGFSSSPHRL